MEISQARNDIVDLARTYIGVPWRHQGRTREDGVDCVGLPLLVGIELDYMKKELSPANYPRRPNNTFIPLFKEYLDAVIPAKQTLGDILVFADSGHPCHCGFMSQTQFGPTIIHAHANDRRVIEEPLARAVGYLGKPVFRFKFKGII